MPNKLRVLSGKEIIKFLEKNGFVSVSLHGSHSKLKRMTNYSTQTLIIPLNKDIPKGTLRDIYDQIVVYLSETAELENLFFTK